MLSSSQHNETNIFYKIFPTGNVEIVNLLTQMLQINPYFRPSAADCLKSPVFDKIRLQQIESLEPDFIECSIDKEIPPVYDVH